MIAVSFIVTSTVGVATTIAVILHEFPQEMGDYGLLLYGGFRRGTALLPHFAVALTVILGGVTALVLNETAELSGVLIAFAAGGFTYLGASELIPQLHSEERLFRSAVQFIAFLLG